MAEKRELVSLFTDLKVIEKSGEAEWETDYAIKLSSSGGLGNDNINLTIAEKNELDNTQVKFVLNIKECQELVEALLWHMGNKRG